MIIWAYLFFIITHQSLINMYQINVFVSISHPSDPFWSIPQYPVLQPSAEESLNDSTNDLQAAKDS